MNDYPENEWHDGFLEPLEHARLMLWLCLFGLVGFLIWLALS